MSCHKTVRGDLWHLQEPTLINSRFPVIPIQSWNSGKELFLHCKALQGFSWGIRPTLVRQEKENQGDIYLQFCTRRR